MCIWYIQYQNFNHSFIDIYIYTNYNKLIYIYINIIYIYIPNTYKFYLIFIYYISIYKSILSSFGSPRSSRCGRRRKRTKRRERRSRCLRGSASCWMVSVVVENDSIRCVAERWKLGGCCTGWSFLVFFVGIWWGHLMGVSVLTFRIFDNLSISIRWMAGPVGS